jgi:hypothetical protein
MADTQIDLGSLRRSLAVRLAVLALAVAVGLALQHVLSEYLERIQTLSQTNMLEARAALARVFELAAVAVFGLTGMIGVLVTLSSRRSLALERFPAPGPLSWGTRRVFTGPPARKLARVGIGLGITLVLASAAGAGLMWYMAAVLRACRAGVRLT